MNVESVFIDIDGTLMDSHGNIPDSSIVSIKKLVNNNVKVVINSGRILPEIKTVLKKIGLALPVIGCNGGFITDDQCENFTVLNPIPKQALAECMEICVRQNAVKCYSTAQLFYTDTEFKPLMEKAKAEHADLIVGNLMAEPIYISENGWHKCFKKEQYIKFNAYAEDPDKLPQLEKELSKVSGISLVQRNHRSLEYSASGINKGYSMLTYLHMHGLHKETSIAIGDGNNDIQMFKAAGIGVAMGNANNDVKQQAGFVTGKINENGLSHILKKLL